jgi:hypothetical protein
MALLLLPPPPLKRLKKRSRTLEKRSIKCPEIVPRPKVEEDTDGAQVESYVPENNRDIENSTEDEYDAETIIESRRSPGFDPPSDAEMSNIIDVDESNYEVESIHGHRGSKVSGIYPRTFSN